MENHINKMNVYVNQLYYVLKENIHFSSFFVNLFLP